MKSNKMSIFGITSLLTLIIESFSVCSVASTYVMFLGALNLTTSSSDTFKVGAIAAINDVYNVQARSDTTGRFTIVDSYGNQVSTLDVANAANYPGSLGTINGLNPWNPTTYARWLMVYNDSANFGTYNVTFEQMRETLSDGDQKTITVNNTLSVLNLELSLAADTAYILMITNLVGTFNSRIASVTTLDPNGNSFPVSTLKQIGTSTVYYYVFVAKVDGTHLFSIALQTPADTEAQLELHSIPNTDVSPNSMQTYGDDPFGTPDQYLHRSFDYKAFSLDVSCGDIYAYTLSQQTAISDMFVAIPGSTAYTLTNPATNPIGRSSDMAYASGKVMLIAIEVGWQTTNLQTYRILFEQQSSQGISIPQDATNLFIDAYSYSSLSFSVPSTMLLRIKITQPTTSPAVTISNLQMKIRGSFLMALDNNFYNDVTNGTETADRIYFLFSGDYYLRISNFGGNRQAQVTIQTMKYDNPVTENFFTPWLGNYNATGNSNWGIFNPATSFQNFTFPDLGKNTGAKQPEVFKFSLTDTTFVQFKFQIRYDANPDFNTPDTWKGNLDFNLIGPNGYYSEYPGIRNYASGGTSFTGLTVHASLHSTMENSSIWTLFPGDYYLIVDLDKWMDVTATPHVAHTGSIILSMAMLNYKNHVLFLNYPITSNPMFHSYTNLANTFRSKKYLDFGVNFNAPAAFTSRVMNFNSRQYDFGIIYKVSNAGAYNWTQLIAYFNNANSLSGSTAGLPAEAYNNGISVIYNGTWSPANSLFYNQQIQWQNLIGNPTPYLDQTRDLGITGEYALEFGVFAQSFWLWINPSRTGTLAQDINQTICTELTQYNTPILTVGLVSNGQPINWTLILVIVAVAAGAVVVVALLYNLKKKNPLGLKYGLRHMGKSKI